MLCSGDTGIDMSKAHIKQYEGNCADTNVIISHTNANESYHTCTVWKMEFSCQFHTHIRHDNK